jgi:hypothetical protein
LQFAQPDIEVLPTFPFHKPATQFKFYLPAPTYEPTGYLDKPAPECIRFFPLAFSINKIPPPDAGIVSQNTTIPEKIINPELLGKQHTSEHLFLYGFYTVFASTAVTVESVYLIRLDIHIRAITIIVIIYFLKYPVFSFYT